jgi:enoyl-CoA hydratase
VGSIVTEGSDGIVVLRIDRPPVNALDLDVLLELASAIEETASGPARALVLTGTGPVFSAGADLVSVLQAPPGDADAGIAALTRCFRSLFVFPKPVVAAVNGHALAGGAVLTCGCDHRVMSSGAGRIGAVEHRAGVPFPAWALELVRSAVNNDHLHEVLLQGRAYKPERAVELGLIDELVEGDPVPRAVEVATKLAEIPPVSYALTKRILRQPSVETADRLTEDTDEDIKRAWRSDEVRAAIKRRLESLRTL